MKAFKDPRLFVKLKCKHFNNVRRTKFCEYAFLVKWVNANDFEWQIEVVWDILTSDVVETVTSETETWLNFRDETETLS